MSRQKEKRLRKLKKQRSWPYIMGILLVVIVFALLAIILTAFFCVNNVFDKLQQAYDNSLAIVQMMDETWDRENSESIKEIGDKITGIMPNVVDVCVVDEKNEMICQYGEDTPDWNYCIPEFGADNVKFILANDKDNFLCINNGEIDIRIATIFYNKWEAGEIEVADDNFLKSKNLVTMSFWYEIPLSEQNYSVCIKNKLPIRETEFFFITVVFEVIIVLAAVLIFYYLISIFSLGFERRKLAKILATDVVTGGFNLQYFIKKGNKLLKKNRKGKYNYAVVTIRMDKYRNFCSCYGVKEGEELLERFNLALQKELSKKEVLAHGEKAEFALLLIYKTEEELIQRLNKMLSSMAAVKAEQKTYFSVGIYKAQNGQVGIDGMYNCACVARNEVTKDSEKRIIWFNEDMNKDQLWTHKVENDMEKALVNKEFQVYLQPKYSTKEEVLSGAEALVRWIHPTEGFVAPFRFIPIFESNGFITQLDDYMITEVARQQAKWIAEGKKVVPISVNVSRVHFLREDLAEHICRLVDQFHVPHDVIELELTESAFFDDKGVLLNTIKKLKSYGFPTSMDDFGSGYSSLNSLRELPLDVVKLDAGFFREADEEERGKLIVGDTISLAKKLDMRIVAEGIETREQVDFLAKMDCDLIQGYYFAKPMPISEFEERAFGMSRTNN